VSTSLWASCPTGLYVDFERPYAFIEAPYRPLSSAFELDTRAVLTDKTYSLSLDLWRNPSAGSPRSATGIDFWSLMFGVSF
jgi:hypothetical protein